MLVDEMINLRWKLRQVKQFKESDQLRDRLDSELVFCFDHKDYQEVHYLTEAYFKKMPETFKTKREYVEYRMKKDRQAEATFKAWLYSHQN